MILPVRPPLRRGQVYSRRRVHWSLEVSLRFGRLGPRLRLHLGSSRARVRPLRMRLGVMRAQPRATLLRRSHDVRRRPRSHAMTHSDDVRLRSDRGVTRWDQDDRRGLTCSGTPVECCPSPVCSDTVHSFHPLYLQPCIPFLRDSEYMLSLFATLRDDNPSPTLVNGEQDF